jgi:hypothetical protein
LRRDVNVRRVVLWTDGNIGRRGLLRLRETTERHEAATGEDEDP